MQKVRGRSINNPGFRWLVYFITVGIISVLGAMGHPQSAEATPKFTGFDFALSEGDFWQFQWDYKNSYWDSFSGGSTTTNSGTFRITLAGARQIAGVTAYEMIVTGKTKASDYNDFAPRWKYLAVHNDQILVSKDESTLTVLFDAEKGIWPGSGFFTTFPANTLFTATPGQINNKYITGAALVVRESSSQSQCEYFPGIGTICGGDYDEDLDAREYYRENIGPIGYYSYSSIADMTNQYPWSSSTTKNLGLVLSSLRGDSVDYDFETEPNNSTNTAQTIYPLETIKGDANKTSDKSDFYTFTLSSRSSVEIILDIAPGGTTPDLDLWLYNHAGDKILASSFKDNPGTRDLREDIKARLRPGTYLILVDAFSGAGSYNLKMTTTTLTSQGMPWLPLLLDN